MTVGAEHRDDSRDVLLPAGLRPDPVSDTVAEHPLGRLDAALELRPADAVVAWWAAGDGARSERQPPGAGTALVPPANLINKVTGPVTSGGLGEPAIELFLHHFPRYAYLCQYSNITSYEPIQSRWP